jgi:hypothetical protein
MPAAQIQHEKFHESIDHPGLHSIPFIHLSIHICLSLFCFVLFSGSIAYLESVHRAGLPVRYIGPMICFFLFSNKLTSSEAIIFRKPSPGCQFVFARRHYIWVRRPSVRLTCYDTSHGRLQATFPFDIVVGDTRGGGDAHQQERRPRDGTPVLDITGTSRGTGFTSTDAPRLGGGGARDFDGRLWWHCCCCCCRCRRCWWSGGRS